MQDDDLAKQFEDALTIEDASGSESVNDAEEVKDEAKTEQPKEEPTDDSISTDDKGADEDTTAGDGEDKDGKPGEASEGVEQPEEDKPSSEEDTPTPITKDDLKSVISDLRTEERASMREIESATDEVIEAYYPKGLSNVLIDEQTGKEIRTPQDVVDLSGGDMSIEEATKWLMNEQFTLDRKVAEIKESAREIAQNTIQFRKDGVSVIERYAPLFDAFPGVQRKVYDLYMKQVKADTEKNVILAAPDMQEFYDTFLEPYKMAFEQKTNQPATKEPEKEEPPKPSVDDRLDISGDGGETEVDDPNDFVSQVKKELAKGA